MKKWIVSKPTQNGLLKDVQDGMSRPLGNQETKVDTILRNTLYLGEGFQILLIFSNMASFNHDSSLDLASVM